MRSAWLLKGNIVQWWCRGSGAQHQPITPGRGRRSGRAALTCNESLQESGDGLSGVSQNTHVPADVDEPTMPAVPKRLRTGAITPLGYQSTALHSS